MDSNLIDRICKLIPALPESDVPFGDKYLRERNFESLQLLVNSSIVRVKKGLAKEAPKEEYLKVDLEKLNKLKVVVDEYYSMLELPEEEDIYDDFDEDEFNEDLYQ